jgi:hypothetical protein
MRWIKDGRGSWSSFLLAQRAHRIDQGGLRWMVLVVRAVKHGQAALFVREKGEEAGNGQGEEVIGKRNAGRSRF